MDRTRVKSIFYSLFTHTWLLGVVLTVFCLMVQHSSVPFEHIIKLPISFERVTETSWSATWNSAKPGTYYISVGRPRGRCDLILNNIILASTKSPDPNLRGSLLLGSGFSITSPNEVQTFEVSCMKEEGFIVGLTHNPIITSYKNGLILQTWRAATELVLGPFFSLLLLLSLITKREKSGSKKYLKFAYLAFAVNAVIYSVSLTHFPRLFFPGLFASWAQSILRAGLSLSYYFLLTRYTKVRWLIVLIYSVLIGLLSVAAVLYKDQFDNCYIYIVYPAFPLLTLWAFNDLLRNNTITETTLLLRYVTVTWILTQTMDVVMAFRNIGAYNAPSILAFITLMITIIKIREDSRNDKIESVTNRILEVIDMQTISIKEKVIELAKLVKREVVFSRVSLYVDAYVLGFSAAPFEVFTRLLEDGYKKETSSDRLIDFRESRGLKMLNALESGRPTLEKGASDGAWYICIPIGKQICINLSNDTRNEYFLAYEAFEVVQRLLPALKTINDQVIEYGSRMKFALERYRLVKGDGVFDVELGSIFLDINSYADNCERYKDPYIKFISTVYLPDLAKAVKKWVVLEKEAGDELYLVCLSELMEEKCSVPMALYKAVTEILKFIDSTGAQLCISQGFEPIKIQIGVNYGQASIACDSFKVRSHGAMVNEAARIQKAAPEGRTFAHADLVKLWPQNGELAFGPERTNLKKNKLLTIREVFLKKSIDER